MLNLISRLLSNKLVKMSTNHQSKYNLNLDSKYRKNDPNHLIWIDCEMTGLDLDNDKLIEIAVIITDNNLNELDRLGPLVLNCDEKSLNSMNDWCKETHSKSGLITKCLQSQLSCEMVDDLFSSKLKEHSIEGGVLAGNSITVDSLFIRKYLNKTANLLHYRLLDVSSIKIIKE